MVIGQSFIIKRIWVYEIWTRNQNEFTRQYPELQGIELPVESAILDGELIVLDEEGKPCFESIMQRFQASKSIDRLTRIIPASFVAFDVLYSNGQSLMNQPLIDRFQLLKDMKIAHPHISVCDWHEDGQALFDATVKLGLEGIVSKKMDSMYTVDQRSHAWIKVKNYKYEVVKIGGIRKKEFAWSLIKDGRYVGTCEFVPPDERSAFWKIAQQIKVKEDDQWIWIELLIKAKGKFQSYTKKGLMRTPSFMEFILN